MQDMCHWGAARASPCPLRSQWWSTSCNCQEKGKDTTDLGGSIVKTFLRSVSLVLVVLCVHSGSALAARHSAHARNALTVLTLRVHAAAAVSPDTTFWVAYGPVGGHFGLVRLQPTAGHMYQARQALPADGRTTFAFLAGHGVITTRFGSAPGDPVQTIQRVGPVSILDLHLPTAEWRAPVG